MSVGKFGGLFRFITWDRSRGPPLATPVAKAMLAFVPADRELLHRARCG